MGTNTAARGAAGLLRRLAVGAAATALLAAAPALAQDAPFAGKIAMQKKDSVAAWPKPPQAPAGAPNVVLIMLDDVGFAAASTFGGPAPTPALDALAAQGLRYNNFHTTAVCSPTRAALLTGRNHHRVGFGTVNGGESGFPGYTGMWNPQTASIAQVLHLNGYSTAAFGKWHNTPTWEVGPLGPYDRWPTSLGFDYFYGFMGGEASQWRPFLYRNTTAVDPGVVLQPGYNFNVDIADQAIAWLHTERAIAPDRPYFLYFTPGATHAPIQVGREWSDRFKGQFDQGWDKLRADAVARQKKLGVVPKDAQVTPRPEGIPAWSSLSADQKKLYARQMEVYAGFLAQTDHEVGRLIQAVREAPGGDNTLIMYIVGDNGPSSEGSLDGSYTNTPDQFNGGHSPPVADQLAHLDGYGGPFEDTHYAAGWSWAMAAPFPWMKQVASHLGGNTNPMVLAWPAHHLKAGGLRSQFVHVNDVAPTLYDLIGVTPPETVNGAPQLSFDGVSFARTLDDAKAASNHHVQYFETLGNRGIYKDGWLAGAKHADPWVVMGRSEDFTKDRWELYDLTHDFAQSHDLAAKMPAKLKEMQALWESEARRNNVYPLGNMEFPKDAPSWFRGREHFVIKGDVWAMPSAAAPSILGSHTLTADITVPPGGADGVIVSHGGGFGGYSLFVKDGRLTYQRNAFGSSVSTVRAEAALPAGEVEVAVRYQRTDPKPWGGGVARIFVNGRQVAEGPISKAGPPSFMGAFCIGRGCGTATGPDYAPPFAFNGTVREIRLDAEPAAATAAARP
jgi:arylsulfatase